MPTFKEHFNIPQNQAVAFVNIPLNSDLLFFIDPFLIANNRNDAINNTLFTQLTSFFTKLNQNFILPNDKINGLDFLSHLHEPNEYHLGYSDTNEGKSISGSRAEKIFGLLRNNRFARQGISITNEAHNVLLLVDGIGPDIMSDTIANVCKNVFANFTTQQCQLYNIQTSAFPMYYYNRNAQLWELQDFQLPSYGGKPIILVPIGGVSVPRSYSGYYNWFVVKNNVSADIINGNIAVNNLNDFIKTLADGTRKAIVKKIFAVYKKPKGNLVDFVLQYQNSLEEFLAYAKEHYPAADLSDL